METKQGHTLPAFPACCKVMGAGGQLFRGWGVFGGSSPRLDVDMIKERKHRWVGVK